jgi:UDP-glucose 4-epimerase
MKYMIVGGSGFIGSHFSIWLHNKIDTEKVTVYDNFSSGKIEYLKPLSSSSKLKIITGDVKDKEFLTDSIKDHDYVFHFASNPDIAKAVTRPDIDFWEGTYLTQNILEAMRVNSIKNIVYASGSGVYGDYQETPVYESMGSLHPISTYGASKLAGEALLSAYSYMFGIKALAFRFANVVGPRQTHGVGYDFLRRLIVDPAKLNILGDGKQSKSYIHIEDIIAGIETAIQKCKKQFDVFNLSSDDYITVTEIADTVIDLLNLKNVSLHYSGGDRGWKGDVPVVRFNTAKIKKLGWQPKYTSKEAIQNAVSAMRKEVEV